MMIDTAMCSAWERREYCGCDRFGSVYGLSFLSSWEMMGRCEVGGISLVPSDVAAPSEVMFG